MAAGPMDADSRCLTWRVHPARERSGAAVFALAVIGTASWAVAATMGSPWWGLLAAALLLAPLAQFFLPSEYRIDDDGVTAESLWQVRRYRWPEVRRFLYDARGGFLSTRSRRSPLDRFRGMHLLFGEHRDQAVSRIRARLSAEEARPCTG